MAFKMKGSAFKLNNVATKSAFKHKAATMTNLQGSQEGGVSHEQLKRHDRRHSQGEEHNSDGDWGKEENTPAPKRDEYGDLLNNENYVDGVKKEPALPMKSPLEQGNSNMYRSIDEMNPRQRRKAMKIARGETRGKSGSGKSSSKTYHDVMGGNSNTERGLDVKIPGIFASKKKKINFLKAMEGNRQGLHETDKTHQGKQVFDYYNRESQKPSGNAMSRDLMELYESKGIDPTTMKPLEGGPKVKSKNTEFGYHDEQGNVIPQ